MFSISLKEYSECLELSKGVIPEFINPKFTADKKGLTSSARLECMMQALPLHDAFRGHKVSFVSFDRGSCFSPIKNNSQEAAAAKAKAEPKEEEEYYDEEYDEEEAGSDSDEKVEETDDAIDEIDPKLRAKYNFLFKEREEMIP